MSGIIRDFSLSSVEHLRNIIKKNVDEDGELFLVDWVKDWFIDDLNIEEYIGDIDTYHAKMVDKYDISNKKFDEILNKVHAVDISYADRFKTIYDGVTSFNSKIINVAALINPSAVTIDTSEYDKLLGAVDKIHTDNMEAVKKHIEVDDAELDDALREVPWYETALDFIAGTGIEIARNNLEGLCFIPFGIIGCFTDKVSNEALREMFDYYENEYILPHIGNKQAYYYGKALGDDIAISEGIFLALDGLMKLAGALTITEGGSLAVASGVFAPEGAAAIAISVPVVIAAAQELAFAGSVAYCGYSHLDNNMMLASTDPAGKITSQQSSLEGQLGKGKTQVSYGDQYRRVNGKKRLKPDVEYSTQEGYKYVTDSEGRISNVEGTLQAGKADRNPYAQANVGKGEGRLSTDDGGHLIASIFKGSGDIDNLVPMNYSLNRGDWRTMERLWQNSLKQGKTVEVNIQTIYSDLSKRPIAFEVEYRIQGENWVFTEFTN